jgi:hypothetical protein
MRYEASELDKTHPVRHLMFVCDCGRTSDQLVAPANETSPAEQKPSLRQVMRKARLSLFRRQTPNRTENTPE